MRLRFFLPDWEDRLDPDFDFTNDAYSKKHEENPYEHDIYAHQLFREAPYDGILFSLSVFRSKISLNHTGSGCMIRNRTKIKDYLKIPEDSGLEVMGDCGAFGYVQEEEPPRPFFEVENVARLYDQLGFDYGVSVDHLAVDHIFVRDKATKKRKKRKLRRREQEKRIRITLRNAEEFLSIWNREDFDYTPIGVAQGYDLDTYHDSVETLIDIGYAYIGLGGLVQRDTDFIIQILDEIQPLLQGTRVHLFGISRPESFEDFKRLGVSTLDSASYFRKAWLRSGQNYLSSDGKWFTAIRIPPASDPRILRNIDMSRHSPTQIHGLERQALQALADYDCGSVSLDDALDAIVSYDSLLLRGSEDGKNLRKKYRRTLERRPWEECGCNVCRQIGIHVVVFRGCNRNKRRGFHNVWTLRQRSINCGTKKKLKHSSSAATDVTQHNEVGSHALNDGRFPYALVL